MNRHLRLAFILTFGLMTSAVTMTAPGHAEDRAVSFMRRAANQLIDAQRRGSPEAFRRVVWRYAHVRDIGHRSLGSYRSRLPRSWRTRYYKGLAKFIGRYAAKEAPKYPVARVVFARNAVRDGRNILVDSRVILRDGTYYNVRWILAKNRGTFKVLDVLIEVPILGQVRATPYLKPLFEGYIAQHGGRVDALVMALNQ